MGIIEKIKNINWKRVGWWFKNLIHIETIFILVLIILVIYVLINRKNAKKITNFLHKYSSEEKNAENPDDSNDLMTHKQKKTPRINEHEERCREIFEEIFQTQFKSVRPDWLKNPVTGKNLELDGFSPKIKTPKGVGLAFEYDGKQHSTYSHHFHRHGPKEFEYQVVKDSWKDKRCDEEGVFLVRIPHFIDYNDLERYIKVKLKRLKIIR